MSDLRDFLNSISSITSDTINLPEFINIKQIGGSQCGDADNTSTDNTELRNVQASTTSESATSSANKTAVLGASVGPTSNISNINQPVQTQSGGNISKLLELLSSESDTELNLSTATDQLEDQLKALLQAGGAMKKKASKKSKKKPSKKSKKKTSKKSKKKPSKKSKKKHRSEVTTSTVDNEATSEEVTSTEEPVKEEPVKEEKPKKKRKANPALKAFAELSKHVSTKLNIPNGPNAKKIAGAVKREYAEKNPQIENSVEIMKNSMKYFDENMEKFKKMI